jgi:hypothetical protein
MSSLAMAMEKFEDQVVPALDYIETFYAEEVPTLPVLHWTDVAVLLEEEPSVISCNEFSRVTVKGYLK